MVEEREIKLVVAQQLLCIVALGSPVGCAQGQGWNHLNVIYTFFSGFFQVCAMRSRTPIHYLRGIVQFRCSFSCSGWVNVIYLWYFSFQSKAGRLVSSTRLIWKRVFPYGQELKKLVICPRAGMNTYSIFVTSCNKPSWSPSLHYGC